MRIVSINVHYQDGLGYQDYYLGLELTRQGHEVIFVSSDWHFRFPDYDRTVRALIGDRYVGTGVFVNDYGVKVHRLKAVLRWTNFYWLCGLTAKLHELEPDLIISHGLLTWQTARLALTAERLSARLIFDDHTHSEVQRKSPMACGLYWLYRHSLGPRIEAVAEKIVGITPETITFIRTVLGIDSRKVVMIPLAADTEIYYPDVDKRSDYRKRYGVSTEQVLIVYTGKIYPPKQAHLIIEALDRLCSTSYDELSDKVVVHYIGSISDAASETFQSTVESSRVTVRVLPPVSQAELAFVYNGADIAVWPASATTSTIDASACGTAIICTNRLPERFKNGAGVGVEPGDVEGLVAALGPLILDDAKRRSIALAGRALVESELNWRSVARQFVEHPK